ncbi:MAG: DUF1559 domain-containing protein [bacterium]|nr:DUF1559 domain-containing protein [bacterium]
MLLPALSKARERARMSLCMNNLKQLALAWKMYIEDYDEILPAVHNAAYRFSGMVYEQEPSITYWWPFIMRTYLNMPELTGGYWATIPPKYRNGILKCPSNRNARGRLVYQLEAHYGMPVCIVGGRNYGSVMPYKKYSEIKRPSEQIIFGDAAATSTGYGGCAAPWNNTFCLGTTPGQSFNLRHGNTDNLKTSICIFAFADGHVEAWTYNKAYDPNQDWYYRMPWGRLR